MWSSTGAAEPLARTRPDHLYGARVSHTPRDPRSDAVEAASQFVERRQFAGDRTGGHGRWAGQPHRTGARAARKVAVDRAHTHLVARLRGTGPAVGTRPARRLQDLGTDRVERREVALLDAVVAHVDGTELQVQLDARSHTQPATRSPTQHRVIAVEVLALAGGARAAVRDV